MTGEHGGHFCFPDLAGKSLLVTGVTRGIGRALLPGFLGLGLDLVLVSRGRERMKQIADDLGISGARVRIFECDLGDPQAVSAVGREIARCENPLYGMLHNAAIDPRCRFEEGSPAFWKEVFQVNVFSAVELTRLLLPGMRTARTGRVIFTGSVMSDLGAAYLTAYGASKGALLSITRALSHELKGSGITVNAVVPGAILVEKENLSEEQANAVIGWQSVGRRLVPADLLGILGLLLSSAGSGISGHSVTVDGGLLHSLADPATQEACLAE